MFFNEKFRIFFLKIENFIFFWRGSENFDFFSKLFLKYFFSTTKKNQKNNRTTISKRNFTPDRLRTVSGRSEQLSGKGEGVEYTNPSLKAPPVAEIGAQADRRFDSETSATVSFSPHPSVLLASPEVFAKCPNRFSRPKTCLN